MGGVADHRLVVGWARSAHLIGSCPFWPGACVVCPALHETFVSTVTSSSTHHPLHLSTTSRMTEQYQQQQQVNLGHPESAEVTTASLNHKAFLVGPAPLNSGPQHQQHNHPASSYLISQQQSYPQAASHSDNSAMTNGSISAVYGYDSPDCGYYEHQDCSSVDVGVQQQQSYANNTRSTCAMQVSVNSPVSVPIQQSSDSYPSTNTYHHLQQQQHHLGQLQHQATSGGGSTVHHFASSNNTAAVEELSPPQDNNVIGKLSLTVSDY